MKEKFKFLCMLLIMYGIIQVYRLYVRLATGPGGLKPIWILAPVAVRFSGRYRGDNEEVDVLAKMVAAREQHLTLPFQFEELHTLATDNEESFPIEGG